MALLDLTLYSGTSKEKGGATGDQVATDDTFNSYGNQEADILSPDKDLVGQRRVTCVRLPSQRDSNSGLMPKPSARLRPVRSGQLLRGGTQAGLGLLTKLGMLCLIFQESLILGVESFQLFLY